MIGTSGVEEGESFRLQGAKSITTFEILPAPPPTRDDSNPWPTWPKILRVDYGHEEVKLRFGKDPRVFNIMSKVRAHARQTMSGHPLFDRKERVMIRANERDMRGKLHCVQVPNVKVVHCGYVRRICVVVAGIPGRWEWACLRNQDGAGGVAEGRERPLEDV